MSPQYEQWTQEEWANVKKYARRFAGGATWAFVIVMVLNGYNIFGAPYDDTDNATTETRSGLKLHTDHGTGCQYLVTRDGHITVRLDRQGKPLCAQQ